MKTKHITVFVITALLITGASCQRRETVVQRGTRDQVLHRGSGMEPSTLDPQRNYGHPENMIIRELFDSLVVSEPRDNEVKPNGAERWEISADGLTYTFHLRANARWSNGDPVVAEDYRASFLRLIEPALGATLAYFADVIAGAEEYRRDRTKDVATVGITTEGPHVLRLRLREPSATLLNHLEHYPFVAVHRPSIEANGGWLNPASPWTRPGKMVSNGAFTLREWKPGNVLVMERNPHYYEIARAALIPFTSEPGEYFDLLKTGGFNNHSGWSSPAFDDRLKRAHSTMDRNARHALYQELDRIVLEEMPLIPFAYYSVARLVDPVVQGWHPSIRDALRLSTLWLSPGEAP